MSARYALYYAPPAGSALARFGDIWLGRAVESGETLAQPNLEDFTPEALHALTEAPRHYGFHGTLKPPFHLAEGRGIGDLQRALAAFTARQHAFAYADLELRAIGDFIALVPGLESEPLLALAAACVTDFDPFRAPPDAGELAKRRAAGLTARQSELLARWGYPYVLDEFRFHLSLTGPIADESGRTRILRALAPLTAPVLREPMVVRELCLFHQPDRTAPFRLASRYPFGA